MADYHFLFSLLMLFSGARQIRALKVKCSNQSSGCEWTGELGELETHLQSCNFAMVTCSNECKVPGSSEVKKVLVKDLTKHLADECPRRRQECDLCSEVGEHEEMISHSERCPRVRVSCPNDPCPTKLLRCDVEAHLTSCEFEPVSCKFAKVGCEERPLRKDLSEHEEDAQVHLRITTAKVLELNDRVVELTQKETDDHTLLQNTVESLSRISHRQEREQTQYQVTVSRLRASVATQASDIRSATVSLRRKMDELAKKKTHAPIVAKMINFNRYKNADIRFTTCSFYTSPTGYCMNVEVYANGHGDDKGTHVSVYAYLMKGDNDDSLTWPFTGTVKIELLNQLSDRFHHAKAINFTFTNGAGGRVVTSGERSGLGKPKFISHVALNSHLVNCQYLKDDTLVFRVSVSVAGYKAWLERTV